MQLEFGPFELDTDRAELRSASGPAKLEPKAFRLLRLLVENNDRVISKDEMIATVWNGRFISDAAVSTALKSVRKALGDSGDRQDYIRTLRGHGHRFVAPVRIRRTDTTTDTRSDTRSGAGPATADRAPDSPTPPGPGERPTVAVLPFTRTGLPDSFAALGDALPSDIISSLARLRWLRVIARESTFRFRDTTVDLEGLRSVLGASYCLSGRVELFGTRLSVSVDLVATRDGALIWSEHFERPLADLHLIRHETVAAVISALDLQIPQAEAALARLKPAEHLDAWEAYHLGLSHMYRFNPHDNAIAAHLFRRATDLDPGFSTAFAARSFTSFQDASMGYTPDRSAAIAAAQAAAERSIELDPLDPYANAAMGRLHILTNTPDDGMVWLDRATGLSPNYAKGHYSRAYLQVLRGQTEDTRAGIDTAISLSPLDPLLGPMHFMKSLSFAQDGDFAKAADWAVRGVRTSTSHFSGVMGAVALCQLGGRATDVAHWSRIARSLRPNPSIRQYLASLPFTNPGFSQTLRTALVAAGFKD
ncbi:winged helix-turn-helix domain-containing protein [Tabrizicola sp. BL-A-41-H6]|uniref:winged helix-turn-helix domain-containing protein n=1 Tax=Tabrizicola sp. BL-A-41-H6 TaxID=3421107 RepID=UPI003D670C20